MGSTHSTQSADGTPIAYRTTGHGRAVLFVHGTATTGADWFFVRSILRDRFEVVTMDRRGRGGSGDAADYAIEREAEDVLAVLAAVGAELLVGHSYGAMCSILAAERSESLQGLVAYEPPIGVDADHLNALEDLIGQGKLDAALEDFLRAVGTTDEQIETIRASPAWPNLRATVPTVPREVGACAAWSHPRGPIQTPSLFLRGGETRSPFYLTGFDELVGAFPWATHATIPGQLHVAHVFAAPAFAELVTDFFMAL